MAEDKPVRRVKPTGLLADLAKAKASPGLVLPLLKEVMIADHLRDIKEQAEANRHIRPSEMCKEDWCPRTTYYRLAGFKMPEEDYNFYLENIFNEGDEIHLKWQARARKTGKLWGLWACQLCNNRVTGTVPTTLTGCKNPYGHIWVYKEVPLRPEGTLIRGSADGAFDGLDTLWELKSIGIGTLRIEAPKLLGRYALKNSRGKVIYDLDLLWKEMRRPFTSHVRQVNIYLWLAEQLGLPFTQMTFLYEFKSNQAVKEWTVTKSPAILDPLLDKARRIELSLSMGVSPPCGNPDAEQCLCREVEELNDKSHPGVTGRQAPTEADVGHGHVASGEARYFDGQVVIPAGRRTTRRYSQHHGDPGPGPDGAVQEAEPLGQVPGLATGRRTSRRALGRLDSREDPGVRADSEQDGEECDRHEGPGVRGPGFYQGQGGADSGVRLP